jgi:hypothetical protein
VVVALLQLGGYAKFLTPAQHAMIARDSFPMMLGRSSGVLRNATWQYSIIRGNMLFKYKDKGVTLNLAPTFQDHTAHARTHTTSHRLITFNHMTHPLQNNVAQVICLNGCTVEATSNNWSKKDTAIKLAVCLSCTTDGWQRSCAS